MKNKIEEINKIQKMLNGLKFNIEDTGYDEEHLKFINFYLEEIDNLISGIKYYLYIDDALYKRK